MESTLVAYILGICLGLAGKRIYRFIKSSMEEQASCPVLFFIKGGDTHEEG